MPVVPGVPTVSTGIRPMPVVQRDGANPDPLAGPARALQQTAGILQGLAVEERRRVDETRVLEADTDLSKFSTGLLSDPESGLFTLQGKNAIGASERAMQSFDKKAAEVLQSLSSPEQKRAMAARIAAQRESLMGSAERHELQQRRAYEVDTAASAVEASIARGQVDPHNATAMAQAETDAVEAAKRFGALKGIGEESTQLMVTEARTKLFAGNIAALLDRDEVTAAEQLFNATKDKLDPTVRTRLEGQLAEGTRKTRGQEVFDQAWRDAKGDPRRALQLVRERSSGDVEEYATRLVDNEHGRQQQRVQEARAARAEAERNFSDAITLKIRRGQPVSDREWDRVAQISPTLYTSLKGFQTQQMNGSAVVTDVRAWTQLQMMTPENLAKVNPVEWIGRLAPNDYERMVRAVTAARRGDTDVNIASVAGSAQQQAMIAARQLGLIGKTGTLSSMPLEQQSAFAEFSGMVDGMREQMAQQLGRRLNPSEETEVLNRAKAFRLVDDTRMDGTFRARTQWANQVEADDAGDWRVPSAAIAPAMRAQVERTAANLAALAGVTNPYMTAPVIERVAAMAARGLITPNLTAPQAAELWKRATR